MYFNSVFLIPQNILYLYSLSAHLDFLTYVFYPMSFTLPYMSVFPYRLVLLLPKEFPKSASNKSFQFCLSGHVFILPLLIKGYFH